jgi:type VI secretion system protein ImpJ
MLLQTLNRHLPLLNNVDKDENVTPFYLYEQYVSLIGDLSTLIQADKKVPVLPVYRHKTLTDVFVPIIDTLRQLLSVVLEQSSVAIALEEKKFGIRVGTISDRSLFTSASFIIAVGADASIDEIRQHFPSQVKIGSVESIKELVNLQLPGIQINHLAAAPREIPYQRQYAYFELVPKGQYWESLCQSSAIAVHVSSQLPNINIELWAIRGN